MIHQRYKPAKCGVISQGQTPKEKSRETPQHFETSVVSTSFTKI